MQFTNIRIIGFDLDNTLYPLTPEMQGRIRKEIYKKLAEVLDIGADFSQHLFESNYNGKFPWSQSGSATIEELGRQFGKKLNGRELVQQSIEEADILDFIEKNPDLVNMLGRLKGKFSLDLITGTSKDLAYAKLKKLGLEETFGNVLTCSKNSGEIYRHWIEEKGVLPEQMLYVGDNPKQDIDLPKNLGIKTCMVGKEYDGADYHIRDILELESLLK